MARLAAILEEQHPGWSLGRTARVVTLQERLVGRVRPWMLLLLFAVGLVLLVACVNRGLPDARADDGAPPRPLCPRCARGIALATRTRAGYRGARARARRRRGRHRAGVRRRARPAGLAPVRTAARGRRRDRLAGRVGGSGRSGRDRPGLRPDSRSSRDAQRRWDFAGDWWALDDAGHGWTTPPKRTRRDRGGNHDASPRGRRSFRAQLRQADARRSGVRLERRAHAGGKRAGRPAVDEVACGREWQRRIEQALDAVRRVRGVELAGA